MKLHTLVLLIAGVPVLYGDLRSSGRTIDQIDLYTDIGFSYTGGDTPHFTAWSGPGNGGNFNGGRIYGSYNDGHGWCRGGGNIGFLEVTRLDWSTKSNTSVACVNAMSGYGGSAQINFPAGWTDGNTRKSYNPFSFSGKLYWFVYRQNQGLPYTGSMSTVIISPDRGLHWCNPATYASHSGSPGCDSSNWSATGDTPQDPSTGMNWGTVNSPSNPVARPMTVQFCQDQNCTGTPFGADNYLYFASMNGFGQLYALCVAKSEASIMSAGQWWYWTGGTANCGDSASWSHTPGAAVLAQAGHGLGYPSSVIYVKEAGQFLMTSYDANNNMLFATSRYPWGPYKRIFISPVGGQGNFVTANLAWLDASCTGCNTDPGRWQLTVAATIVGHTFDLSLVFYKLDLSNGGPMTPETAPGGSNRIGRLPIRTGQDGLNKRLVLRNLKLSFGFDDFVDYPSLSGLNTYFQDALGSGVCFVSASNPPGTLAYGTQNPVAPVSMGYDGITLGGQYLAQLTSANANCNKPIPLTGNASYTIQMIVKPSSVTKNGGMLWELYDPTAASAQAHKAVGFGINIGFEGGTHLDFRDYNVTIQASPTWSAGSYYLVTLTKSAGVVSTSNTKMYLGGTPLSTTLLGTSDGVLPNFPSNLKMLINCAAFGTDAGCQTGNASALGATYSYLAVYDRALTPEEVARNYAALKIAMAEAPRNVTLQ